MLLDAFCSSPVVDDVNAGTVVTGYIRFLHCYTNKIGVESTRKHSKIGAVACRVHACSHHGETSLRCKHLTCVQQTLEGHPRSSRGKLDVASSAAAFRARTELAHREAIQR